MFVPVLVEAQLLGIGQFGLNLNQTTGNDNLREDQLACSNFVAGLGVNFGPQVVVICDS